MLHYIIKLTIIPISRAIAQNNTVRHNAMNFSIWSSARENGSMKMMRFQLSSLTFHLGSLKEMLMDSKNRIIGLFTKLDMTQEMVKL